MFFPLATLYAIFVMPASVLAMLGLTRAFPALASPIGHAHEMLFGFALAVVAGNQLGPMAVPRLTLLVVLWLIARVSFVVTTHGITATAASIAFAVLLAVHVTPRLFGAAKKWRNQALPMVLTAICASAVVLPLFMRFGSTAAEHRTAAVAVLLFAVLMIFMGGRIIGPTAAGHFQRQGGTLEARVQPRIEGALLIVMAIATVACAFTNARTLAGAAIGAAGTLSVIRLMRWRLWELRGRPDLLCLAAGYGWLAAGLLLYGLALGAGRHETAVLHLITVGALGTLTLNVMHMTWSLKARSNPARSPVPVWATLFVGIAALLRLLAGMGVGEPRALLLGASFCWSFAFVLLLVRLLRLRSV
ncbi:MAG: NnrS family protein [Betaproteobacteria bacterium]|nr:NnrS family protein [Betaproteobacteria bacterium]